jgi:hypothetical protein
MSSVIIGLFLVAMVYFVYESIIAPSLRLNLRFELFRLRDELRKLKGCCPELSDKHFESLQDSINGLVSVLYRLDLATLIAFENTRRRDTQFKNHIEERVRALDDCHCDEAQAIRARSREIAAKAIAVNNGAWFGFILPAIFAAAFYSKAKWRIGSLLSLSERDLRKVVSDMRLKESS